MKNKLLLEGAVAGHMNHIYDNGEMTFGELKQLLQAAVDGKLRGTEKTDGQNIFLSFDIAKQQGRAIRNKTHIKAGGLNVEELDNFFSEHPNQALRYSFVEALQSFEDAIKQIDKETQFKIFGNKEDNIYFNAEVMNPGAPDLEEDDPRSKGTTNVIPYDKKTLLIHEVGHGRFHPKTALSLGTNLDRNYSTLENALVGSSTDDPNVFSIETHPRRKLDSAGMKRASEVLAPTFEAIDNIVRDFNLNDSNTIQDLVMVQVKPIIDQLGLTEDRNKLLMQRVFKLCRSKSDPSKFVPCGQKDSETGESTHLPRPTMRDISAGVPQELRDEIKKFDDNFKYQDYTAALSSALYDFTNAILEGFNSSFIENNEQAIQSLRNQISQSIQKIQSSSNEAAKQDLQKQLKKLKDVKNVNTPSEGFVFDFNGTTYKFTGWFAPSNQILGTERYGRFGPIEPAEDGESALQGDSKPLTIALFPGSFKPPHLGHVKAAEALGQNADVVYIFVSAPQLSGRALKSGGTISADDAIQCWNVMIDKSPLKNKARVMVGPRDAASPMMTAINFIQHPASPDNLFAAPENATVILGVGAKGSDADRYGEKIMQKSKQMRPDLKIVKKAVGPFTHSEGYLELLRQNPNIANTINKGKGRVSPDELTDEERVEGRVADKHLFHASDMRDYIDLAAENPIGIEFLKYFVPHPEDALAILGILGINPADPEPKDIESLDDIEDQPPNTLDEIIYQEAQKFYEGFKQQKAPKGKPDSGIFQGKVRKNLSDAHGTYLDLGRKDLTKYGGAFKLDRPKDISNAFLAESEDNVEEITTTAAVQGAPGAIKRKNIMTREEKKLRKKIRINLKKFFESKAQEHEEQIANILEEHRLRLKLRNIILEQSINEAEDPNVDIHDNTGINTLKDFMKNTNVLVTLRDVYKTLTTSEDQKRSFRAHMIKWVEDTLAPVKLNDTDAEGSSQMSLAEDVGVDIQGVDADKFIPADDGSEKDLKPEPEEDNKMKPIDGEDTTGRNKAERVYPSIEKSIIDYYGELDNVEDQEMFYDYLIANLKLYFDKWDGEMSKVVSEPESEEYDQAKQTA